MLQYPLYVRQLALRRLPYLPVHKELPAGRLQKKKLSQRLSTKKIFFGWAWPLVGEGVWGGEQRRRKKSHFQQAASSQMCKEMQNSISKFYQFQTDSRQSPSGYVPACLARARRMAREAAITDPEWRRERPMAKRSRIWHPITVVGKYKSPPLLLLTRLLTVHWIKQQSELSSSLHWDVGHWLHPIHSGKIAEAWYYSLHTNINTSDMYINYTINCTSDR